MNLVKDIQVGKLSSFTCCCMNVGNTRDVHEQRDACGYFEIFILAPITVLAQTPPCKIETIQTCLDVFFGTIQSCLDFYSTNHSYQL